MTRYEKLVRTFRPLIRFLFPYRMIDMPKTLPEEGIIVCCNHISFFDPLYLAVELPRPLTFMGKEELTRRPIIGKWVTECEMIPLSRDGGDAAKLRQAVRALKEGKVLAIFPQGTRCSYPLREEDFKAGAGMMAALSGAKILPVGIASKNYKVKLFRRCYLKFGDLLSVEAPQELSKKEQSLFVSEKIYQAIKELEQEARLAVEKRA